VDLISVVGFLIDIVAWRSGDRCGSASLYLCFTFLPLLSACRHGCFLSLVATVDLIDIVGLLISVVRVAYVWVCGD